MRNDLIFGAKASIAIAVPMFLAFAWLWNLHGSLGSMVLHFIGFFGIAPFLYAFELVGYQAQFLGLALALVAQYFWFALWVLLIRRLWHYRQPSTSSRNQNAKSLQLGNPADLRKKPSGPVNSFRRSC